MPKPNGPFIRARRNELGLSLADAAKVAEYGTPATFRNIENGNHKNAPEWRLRRIARNFDVPYDSLVIDEDALAQSVSA